MVMSEIEGSMKGKLNIPQNCVGKVDVDEVKMDGLNIHNTPYHYP